MAVPPDPVHDLVLKDPEVTLYKPGEPSKSCFPLYDLAIRHLKGL